MRLGGPSASTEPELLTKFLSDPPDLVDRDGTARRLTVETSLPSRVQGGGYRCSSWSARYAGDLVSPSLPPQIAVVVLEVCREGPTHPVAVPEFGAFPLQGVGREVPDFAGAAAQTTAVDGEEASDDVVGDQKAPVGTNGKPSPSRPSKLHLVSALPAPSSRSHPWSTSVIVVCSANAPSAERVVTSNVFKTSLPRSTCTA